MLSREISTFWGFRSRWTTDRLLKINNLKLTAKFLILEKNKGIDPSLLVINLIGLNNCLNIVIFNSLGENAENQGLIRVGVKYFDNFQLKREHAHYWPAGSWKLLGHNQHAQKQAWAGFHEQSGDFYEIIISSKLPWYFQT